MENNAGVNDLLSDITVKEDLGKQLLMMHGQLNQDVIISAIKLTERKLLLESVPATLITKAKIISTEMLQNILKHQVKHDSVLPHFIMRLTGNGLSLVSNNVVSAADKEYITDQMEKFSNVRDEELRAFYIEAFRDASISATGNAGLGLLDIFYRSKKKVSYRMEALSSGLYTFRMDVTVLATA